MVLLMKKGKDSMTPASRPMIPSKGMVEARRGLDTGKTHKGLPFISEAEYRAQYRTESTQDMTATFDFQGYVGFESGTIRYMDVLATNGLRGGIHVGIDGIDYYSDQLSFAQGPSDIREYVVYVTIPLEVRMGEGLLCYNDECLTIAQYRKKLGDAYTEAEKLVEIDNTQRNNRWMVKRTGLTSRDHVKVLALAINEYIRDGRPLQELEGFIHAAESHIKSNTEMARDETLLGENPQKAWERFRENLGF